MKITAEMIANIRNIIDEMDLDCEYGYIGIRVQEQPFELGALDHVSRVWIDGEETGEELPGVSVIGIDALDKLTCSYFGDHVAIICGDSVEYGEDFGELIIADPVVASIIC